VGISEAELIALQDRMRRNGAPAEAPPSQGRPLLARDGSQRPGGGVEKTADVPEALIQAECTNLLEMDGWRALRTDPVSDRGRGKGFGEIGMADNLYVRYWSLGKRTPQPHDQRVNASHIANRNELMWIEFKRGRGGVLSK